MARPLLTTGDSPSNLSYHIALFKINPLNTRSLTISGMFCFIKTMQTEKLDLAHEYQSQWLL